MYKIDIPNKGNRKRIIIVGGGFGGLKLARKLKSSRYQVVLIDKNNYHLFQPLLYQVATAGIEPSSISFPFRKIFKGRKDFHIRLCSAKRVIPEKNLLETSIGSIEYDYLIIATGCNVNYFGNDKLAQSTMSLKTTSEALFDRNKILESFELALNAKEHEDIISLMTFVIVGGGPTGIELAGALAEMRNYILPKDFPDLDISHMRIILIDNGKRLLSTFSESSSAETKRALGKKGVEIMLETRVMDYQDNELTLNNTASIFSDNVFWVGGVTANSIAGFPETLYGHGNRILVDPYNRVKGYDHIFAIGDTALMQLDDYPQGHPQVVQPALQQANNLISNLKLWDKGKNPRPFRYKEKGSMATIGKNQAVVELPKLHFSGFPAWIVWLFVHLMSILGIKNKIFVFLNWVWSYFTNDPTLRLIIKPVIRSNKKL